MKKVTIAVLLCLLLCGCTALPPRPATPQLPQSQAPHTVESTPAAECAPPDSVGAEPAPGESAPPESIPPESTPADSTPPMSQQPSADPAQESLAALRHAAAGQGALCAAAYLGYAGPQQDIADFLAGDAAASLLAQHPFLAAIGQQCRVQQPGGEVYCIVPPAGGSVQVHIYVEDGVTPPLEKGESSLLYAGGDDPILLQGNESDILPNLQVTVAAADGSAITFAPCISLKDGSFYPMGAEGDVLDFTADAQ